MPLFNRARTTLLGATALALVVTTNVSSSVSSTLLPGSINTHIDASSSGTSASSDYSGGLRYGMTQQDTASQDNPSAQGASASESSAASATPGVNGTPSAGASVSAVSTSDSSISPNPLTPSPNQVPATSADESRTSTPSAATRSQRSIPTSGSDATPTGDLTDATPPSAVPGWVIDWSDTFDSSISKWNRYGWAGQTSPEGAMGGFAKSNAFVADGALTLRTKYEDGKWSAAGANSSDLYVASGGRWEVRAKLPNSKGIGFAFHLFVDDGSWVPEIPIADGLANEPHYLSQFLGKGNIDMSQWHTYGVILGDHLVTYTVDGQTLGTVNRPVTNKNLWIGFQCAAMDPSSAGNPSQAVDDGVPGPLTPAVSDIQIDWVAHYSKA